MLKKTPDRKTQVPQPRGGGTCVLCLLFCIGRAEENCQSAYAFSKAVSVRAEASNDCSWRATTMKTRRSSSANARGSLPSWKRAITWTLKPISRSSITAKRCTKPRNTCRNIVNITPTGREPRRCYGGIFMRTWFNAQAVHFFIHPLCASSRFRKTRFPKAVSLNDHTPSEN